MIVRLFLWSLADSKTTVEELRRHLRDEAVEASASTPGLRLRAWVSDATTERWGSVSLWETREALDDEPPDGIRELIGKDPEIAELFDVEATIEGEFVVDTLSRLGLAFEQ